jgi:hypothetical protein
LNANRTLEARAHEDKIRLLREAAEREANERRVREREGLIQRIEGKLAERDAAGVELAESIARADRAYRRLIDIGLEVQAAWNWPPSDFAACLLSHPAISAALTHEMYRVGGRPMLGGGQVEKPHAGINFPGAPVPRFELTHLPERIPALTAVLQQATEHASNILRGKRPGAPGVEISTPVAVAAPVVNGNAVPRTAAQERLSDLNSQLVKLGEDMTPAGEQEYQRVVSEIAQVQGQIAKEQW